MLRGVSRLLGKLAETSGKSAAELDAERLISDGLPLATTTLREYREFHPFGAAIGVTGERVAVSVDGGNDWIASLRSRFVQGAQDGSFRATALFFDAFVTPPGGAGKSDAIVIEIDHRDGHSVMVYVPYTHTDEGPVYGERFVTEGRGGIFPSLH